MHGLFPFPSLFRNIPIAKDSIAKDSLIAFGSNQGDSAQLLKLAAQRLGEVAGIKIHSVSQPFETRPVGGPAGQDSYLNAVIRVEVTLSASELHQQLIRIETELGRQRRQRWGSRKIDLDLLIYGSLELESDDLTIPHPRMSFRRFVLDPAAEVASELVHSTSGVSIGDLLNCLNSRGNSILFVGSHAESKFAAMISGSLPAGWSLSTIVVDGDFDREEFVEKSSSVKLVTFVAATDRSSSRSGPCESKRMAASFGGPTLRLPPDLEKARVEIEAAIEAMW